MPLSPGRDAFTAKQAWGLPMWHLNSSSWEQSSWETKPFAHHLVSSCHLPNSKENGSEARALPCTLSAWREGDTCAHVQHTPRAHQSHQGFATGEKPGHCGEGGHRHGGGAWSAAQTPSTVGRAQAAEDGSACSSGSGSSALGSELPSRSSALFSTLLRPWRLTSMHFPLASGLDGRTKGKHPWDM